MPIDVRLTNDGCGALFIGSGSVTGGELIAADELLYQSEARLRTLRYHLCDDTNVVSTDASASDIVVAAAGRSDLVFGLMQMWETLVDVFQGAFAICVVRSLDEAKDWIHTQTGLTVPETLWR